MKRDNNSNYPKARAQVHTVMRRYKYLSDAVHHLESSPLKSSVSCESFNGISFCMRRATNWGFIIFVILVQCLPRHWTELVAVVFYVFLILISPHPFIIALQFSDKSWLYRKKYSERFMKRLNLHLLMTPWNHLYIEF